MMCSVPFTRRGFTLIELLIVVAIIAILAAIAVPNFLEAQTRAKVSRARADMRSIGIGLEAYMVDENAYPVAGDKTDYESKLSPLTTPVAFMSSVPRSAFAGWLSFGQSEATKVYYYQDKKSCDDMEALYGYKPDGSTSIWHTYDITGQHRWYLSCVGPDGDFDQPWTGPDGCNALEYDPTNGTTSDGDVLLIGPR